MITPERKNQIMNAAETAYQNALEKCYFGAQLAAYMFLEGMKYQKTGIPPKNALDEEIKNIRNSIKK